jgi:glycosyltransferase involved in cell wall biosynthesis
MVAASDQDPVPVPLPVAAPDRPLLLFVVTEDWYFWSHRLPMARAARAAGFDVAVATRVDHHGARIQAEGFRLLPLGHLRRRGLNPLAQFRAVAELAALYRRQRPAIVHHVAMKPVLYGSLAARLAGVRRVVNAMAGLGFVYTSGGWMARLLRPVVTLAFRLLLTGRGVRLLVQNADDRAFFVDRRLVAPERVVLVPGSGVDIRRFAPTPEPEGPPVALFVGRLLWDKGLGELMEAARRLKARRSPLRLWLAGDRDPANPRCVPEDVVAAWDAEGLAEILGRRDDVAALWARAHVAVLPSHREGMPKALLEAAAAGRPLVATDVPGCRELVRDGVNGLLVPLGDVEALAAALDRLAGDAALRARLGAAARRAVEETYSEAAVGAGVVALYRSLLKAVP